MICVNCGSDKTRKYGKTVSEVQRWHCRDCDRKYTVNPTGRPVGTTKPEKYCLCGKKIHAKGMCQNCYRKEQRKKL